jgi:hypothetical protein
MLLTLAEQCIRRNQVDAVTEGLWTTVEEPNDEVAGDGDGGGDCEHCDQE